MSLSSLKNALSESGAWRALAGLATDYWKDGPDPILRTPQWIKRIGQKSAPKPPKPPKQTSAQKTVKRRAYTDETDPTLWHATRPQVLEALWGAGYSLPGGNDIIDAMTVALGLSGEMNVLDLSAGLGATGRRLCAVSGTYVTGYETDSEVAAHGMRLSLEANMAVNAPVEAYNPLTFSASKHYHCVMAREMFFLLADKRTFFKEISNSLFPKGKPRGQVVFSDYVLEKEDQKNSAVKAWLSFEEKAKPLCLAELTKLMKKSGLDVRVSEDLTDKYRLWIMRGLAEFSVFVHKHKPDTKTKRLAFAEVELWAHREAAFRQGLKFYRFYAIKA